MNDPGLQAGDVQYYKQNQDMIPAARKYFFKRKRSKLRIKLAITVKNKKSWARADISRPGMIGLRGKLRSVDQALDVISNPERSPSIVVFINQFILVSSVKLSRRVFRNFPNIQISIPRNFCTETSVLYSINAILYLCVESLDT